MHRASGPVLMSRAVHPYILNSVQTVRASVFPFQNCVNSVSGFVNSVFYRFRFDKFRFLPFQIFKILFHFFQTVFLVSMIFVKFILGSFKCYLTFFWKFDTHPLVTLR